MNARLGFITASTLTAIAGTALAQGPVLLGSDASNGTLVTIDPASGATTLIGPMGFSIVSALAYDPINEVLYGFVNATNQLIRIDPNTGVGSLIGQSNIGIVHGMAYDSLRQTLYAVTSFGNNSLYTMSTTTGLATLVGPHGKGGLQGIVHDPATDTMYAAEVQEKRLYILDTSSAAVTPVGDFNQPGGVSIGNSLAWDPNVGLLATDNKFSATVDDELYDINPATGQATLIGRLNTGNCLGLEFLGPAVLPCYPDCDTTTGVGVLDIFDFLCFGNRFSAGDPYACDCDTSTGLGVCDIFDFLCFGNAFNAGCP